MLSFCAASLWIVTLNYGTVMNGDGSSIVKSPVTGSRLFSSTIATSLDHRSAPTASPSVFVTTPSSAPYTFTLTEGDATLNCKNWDVSPFIVLKEKLIFLATPKSGSTVVKQLLQKIEGLPIRKHFYNYTHDPHLNGLKRLCDFSPADAERMLKSDDYLKVVIVRDPHSIVLSYFLDKVVQKNEEVPAYRDLSFPQLVDRLARRLPKVRRNRYDRIDNHFLPQHIRGDLHKTLPVYHVIHFDNMQEGVGKVLSEWRGNLVQRYGLEALLKRYIHPTNATQKLVEYYTPQLWRQVYEMYVTDFLLFGWEASPPVSLKDSE
ncbi:hypothetical protein QOT17_000008 [Balamuthia mandrillaris]